MDGKHSEHCQQATQRGLFIEGGRTGSKGTSGVCAKQFCGNRNDTDEINCEPHAGCVCTVLSAGDASASDAVVSVYVVLYDRRHWHETLLDNAAGMQGTRQQRGGMLRLRSYG